MTVAGHQCAKAQIEVDVFIAIDVVNVAAFAVLHENRIRIVGAVIAGHAKRNARNGFGVRGGGFGGPLLISIKFLLQSWVHNSSVVLVILGGAISSADVRCPLRASYLKARIKTVSCSA